MNLLEKVYCKFFDRAYMDQKISYSQCGEDLIVDFLLTWVLKIEKPTYLDIGAHHPWSMNNTMRFYKRGSTGINIEPDPVLFHIFPKFRSKDININKGVGFGEYPEVADFYIMSYKALNTFSKVEAERIASTSDIKIENIQQVELININDILSIYHSTSPLDFLSIDVEGLDLDVLKSIEFERYTINVICVETLKFIDGINQAKKNDTSEFLLEKGFKEYANTSINTIFVRGAHL
jgi:FkbM family methyltransferase